VPIYWLSEKHFAFPATERAEPDGLLAVGGGLEPERLLEAYRLGIFPWYGPEDPILWWSPDPRAVLFPVELKVSRSMRPYFNQPKYTLSFDRDFETVMRECATARRHTWIVPEMVEAYCRLHEMGYAHSVEVWQEGVLVGGLYGLALGKIFFGESMFSKAPNASKFGFISLVRQLEARGFRLIDCQQETPHLASLGARPIPRKDFVAYLRENDQEDTWRGKWFKG
jgi:leucyl/phenylalanyl-tRNA--protein transferase